MTLLTDSPSTVVADAVVRRVERLSPSFVRVELASPEFTRLAEHGFDTRFKMVVPDTDGRPVLRTYTIRAVERHGRDVRLVVDLVVHGDHDPDHGRDDGVGPACRWALGAAPGDVVGVVAPRRGATYGGTEFAAAGRPLLLIGDETALPALSRILLDVDAAAVGTVFVEVPVIADAVELADLPRPPGVDLRVLTRSGWPCNRRLVGVVRRHLGLPGRPPDPARDRPAPSRGTEAEIWETPAFSAAGEDLAAPSGTRTRDDLAQTYAWIAGESWMVRALRRTLVSELGLPRGQVAFMGYWREGVAARS